MATARNRRIALLVTLLIVAAGCSRAGSEPGPTASIATASSSEAAPSEPPSETPSPDPYAIPDDPADIDAAYVERVLEELMVSIADAARSVARTRSLTPEAIKRLRATHRETPGSSVVGEFRTALRKDPTGRPFSRNASPTTIDVREVVSASRGCIFVRVLQDTSGLVRQEIQPFAAYYQIEAKRPGDDPHGLNKTPWVIVADAEPRKDGKEYADPC